MQVDLQDDIHSTVYVVHTYTHICIHMRVLDQLLNAHAHAHIYIYIYMGVRSTVDIYVEANVLIRKRIYKFFLVRNAILPNPA